MVCIFVLFVEFISLKSKKRNLMLWGHKELSTGRQFHHMTLPITMTNTAFSQSSSNLNFILGTSHEPEMDFKMISLTERGSMDCMENISGPSADLCPIKNLVNLESSMVSWDVQVTSLTSVTYGPAGQVSELVRPFHSNGPTGRAVSGTIRRSLIWFLNNIISVLSLWA